MRHDEFNIHDIINSYILPQLHPDLQPYLVHDELHHPLVHLVGGVFPRLYPRINKLYAYQQAWSIQRPLINEWQSYLPHLPVDQRILQFTREEYMREDFPRQTPGYLELIGQIWTDPELLGQTSSFLELMLGMDSAVSWDRLRQPLSPHIAHLMTPGEQSQLAKLPPEFTVFRGHATPLFHGLSWTLSCDIALQYAIGSPLKSSLSIGTIQKSAVIALIDRWDENEIIVPSKAVTDIQTIEIGAD
jgi:hypothetical protein